MPNRDDYISESTRRLVEERADKRCEYCLIYEEDTYIGCEIDHIISIKHGGKNNDSNLAFSCFPCNRFKGTDIASFTTKGILSRFFNPRIDNWTEHFKIQGNMILGISDIGEVTVKILKFNEEERLEEREYLQDMGLFPK
jgi:HNH endonuclease